MVSQKVLSRTLKRLKRDGIVTRKVFSDEPGNHLRLGYPLRPGINKCCTAIVDWASINTLHVIAAQIAYDKRTVKGTPSPS
jgi:DNA-binding HxlR family transcriptional regulator